MPKKYFVTLEAKPGPKMEFDPPGCVAGFFQNLGVTVEDAEQLLGFVHKHLEETELGATLVGLEELGAPDFDGLDKDLAEYREASEEVGIWYVSGHAFYYPEDEREENDG